MQKEGKIADNKVSLVIYDREPSGAHDLAMSMGIPTVQVKKVHYNERESFEKSLLKECRKHDVDKVFLLGFNYLLKHSFLQAYKGAIVNVHPSLLPAFKGKRAIQQAMEYGVKITGLTTHLIDDKLDEGKIICQEAISIDSSMTFDAIDQLYMDAAPRIFIQTMLSV